MKRFAAAVLATAFLCIGTVGASATEPEGNAHGKDCGFGERHAEKARNGEVGGDGHKPGNHRGASTCD